MIINNKVESERYHRWINIYSIGLAKRKRLFGYHGMGMGVWK